MAIPPALAWSLASLLLEADELRHLRSLPFNDAGHGWDAFGMHPAFVALGMGITRWPYERYFRVSSYRAERVPREGPVVLACNHSGTVPVDGMMLFRDVVLHAGRIPRPVADHFVPTLPWLGELFARAGMVGGSEGNARALLQAGEVLMIFPEGVPGIGKPFSERYRLQEWRKGHCELAIRHGASVVPVGIVGAEEQMPQVARLEKLGQRFGLPYVPVPLTPLPLPVHYHILYGEPLRLDREFTPADADDPDLVAAAAERVKHAVDALLQEGLDLRPGVFA